MAARRAAARLLQGALQRAGPSSIEPIGAAPCPSFGAAHTRAPAAAAWAGRGVATSAARRAAPPSLADALRAELELERASYTQPAELAAGPPAPWTLTESQGDTLLTLSRSYGAAETVEVMLMVNDQPDEEEELYAEGAGSDADGGAPGEPAVDVGVAFTVTVAREGAPHALVAECRSDGDYLDVTHLALEPADDGGAPDFDDALYTGPVYDELDDDVRAGVDAYLAERGVTPALGGFLLAAAHDKERREYVAWLDRLRAFVAAK